ncbi:MAG: putative Xaa-Pro aminopeptidase [Candidatus Saccharibacteria bacterium]|nr:putative Xaa-Pro aminopeptidase [Candidatus Saccharibacteria bacterium]
MNTVGAALVVLSAYTTTQRSNDMAHVFDQEANFWWLTGIEAPDWRLIIDGKTQKSWLVAPRVESHVELFDGSLAHDEAKAVSGVDGVVSREEAAELLFKLARQHDVVFGLDAPPFKEYVPFTLNPAPATLWRELKKTFQTTKSCRRELARLRAIKQLPEIEMIKQAVELTTGAFTDIYAQIDTFTHEYEVEAAFTYAFQHKGATHAYDPIVASGAHACTLHYIENRARIDDTSMMLLDVGARIGGYAADITRTYARSRTSQRGRDIHHAVELAHADIIALLRPGLSVKEYSEKVDSIMKQALIDLGLIHSAGDAKGYRKYFPHAISHGLGIDVHDSLGNPEVFVPGMVLTVEPGIYIPEEGIGVRLEDDILITETAHHNLSARLPSSL